MLEFIHCMLHSATGYLVERTVQIHLDIDSVKSFIKFSGKKQDCFCGHLC